MVLDAQALLVKLDFYAQSLAAWTPWKGLLGLKGIKDHLKVLKGPGSQRKFQWSRVSSGLKFLQIASSCKQGSS